MSDFTLSLPLEDFIRRVFIDPKPPLLWLRRLLIASVLLGGLAGLVFSAQSLVSPYVYMKDFIQEYLLARAVLARENPYLYSSVLAAKYIGHLPNPIYPHPTPHPPAVILLALPLGLLDYQLAAAIWFVLELLILVIVCALLLNTLKLSIRIQSIAVVFSILMMWSPFLEDLLYGQLTLLLLLFLTLLWRALRSNNELQAGICLGALLSFKLMGWPFALLWIFQRKWRTLGATLFTVAGAHILTVLLMGWRPVVDYYFRVGGEVAPLYRSHVGNFSLWTVGWRLFDGTGSPVLANPTTAPPLISAPSLAPLISLLLPVLITVVALISVLRFHDIEGEFAFLICVSVLVNPVAWNHYLMLALISLVVAARRLRQVNFPLHATLIFLLICLLMWIPRVSLHDWISTLGLRFGGTAEQVPFAIGMLSFLPAVAVLALATFLWWLHLPQQSKKTMATK